MNLYVWKAMEPPQLGRNGNSPDFFRDEGQRVHRGLEATSHPLIILRQEASFQLLLSIAVVSFGVAVEPEFMALLFCAGFEIVLSSVDEMEDGTREQTEAVTRLFLIV
jgi:hypothetical protein